MTDGLPQDLEASIRAYGLQLFQGQAVRRPRARLSAAAAARPAARARDVGEWHVTLDGNENFHDFAAFREYWELARAEPALRGLWRHVLVVEQPVHRDHAL